MIFPDRISNLYIENIWMISLMLYTIISLLTVVAVLALFILMIVFYVIYVIVGVCYLVNKYRKGS